MNPTDIDAAPAEAADPAEVSALLGPALAAPAGTLGQLRSGLAAAADASGDLDVAYRIVESPVGPLLLAATPLGLVRVAFAAEGHAAVLAQLAGRIGPRILEYPPRLEDAARELAEYFAGARTRFDIPLDRRLSKGFRRAVQERLPDIPYGHTASYSELAAAAGSPRAVRAVGSACATNPLPVVVPCHRVLRSDGGLGGYIGGTDAKTALLELERAA
ncbi:MAG: methylated-DNA--[protein]-cysteine S-methyltransferase [Arthrobacter sp.]|uniref:methylated-DNA--[protein]-cysteine S-methyltransferase n=1 Tax=Arthrobacter sp. TaxID=1667 RepID=UPI003492D3D4